MELPPDTSCDDFVLEDEVARAARRRRVVPWVPVVLCGVIMTGVLFYESQQVRRLQAGQQDATEALAAAERELAANVEAQQKLELALVQEKGTSVAQEVEILKLKAEPPKQVADPAVQARVEELEKLVLFLRDELKASSATVEQLRSELKSGKAVVTPATSKNIPKES